MLPVISYDPTVIVQIGVSLMIVINSSRIFIVQTTGVNIIKLLKALIYESAQSTSVYVPGIPFQPRLMFGIRLGVYRKVLNSGRLKPANKH